MVKVSSLLCRTLLKDLNWTKSFHLLCGCEQFRGMCHRQDLLKLTPLAVFNIPSAVSVLPAATKADGFALYFLGESNNVSADDIY